MDNKNHHVAILGASNKPQRYAYRALSKLVQHGYTVTPVHPKLDLIDEHPVKANLTEITEPVTTLTLYLGPERSQTIVDDIIKLNPGRVIFNPGTESEILEKALEQASIPYIKDCTLIMLDYNLF